MDRQPAAPGDRGARGRPPPPSQTAECCSRIACGPGANVERKLNDVFRRLVSVFCPEGREARLFCKEGDAAGHRRAAQRQVPFLGEGRSALLALWRAEAGQCGAVQPAADSRGAWGYSPVDEASVLPQA